MADRSRAPGSRSARIPIERLAQFCSQIETEIGATITINGERVELGVAGKFRKTVEMFKEGWNDILIVATDPSGNHSEHRERVFVEVY